MIFLKARQTWAFRQSPHCPNILPLLSPLIFGLVLLSCTSAQTSKDTAGLSPLPQDSGKAGLELILRRLSTTARLMHTTAHPDDEDCGPAVNPDGMRAQAEGCLMQGISRSLIEELKWGPNGITSRDWVLYPVIRFKAMPKFDFQIINRIDEPILGAGEVLITNVPAAIGNAIFDATSKRMRQVPFTPARVRAALAS